MPVTVEDKIELFRKMLFGDIEAKSSERKKTLLDNFEKERDQLRQEIESKKDSIIKDAITKAEKEKQQLFSKLDSEQHHKLLEKQQEYISKTLELIAEKAINYVSSSDYLEKYLKKCMELVNRDFADAEELIFYFAEGDLKLHDRFIKDNLAAIIKNKNCIIEMTSKKILGGFIVEDKAGVMQADYTLAALIQDNRDIVGISIAQIFNEVI